MSILLTTIIEAFATLATIAAHAMTLGCGIFSLNEPEMPKQLLKK